MVIQEQGKERKIFENWNLEGLPLLLCDLCWTQCSLNIEVGLDIDAAPELRLKA
jgi:hypothetical protein